MFLSNREGMPDDQLFSPYLGDEPVDHDSLHLALAKRRHMHSKAGTRSTVHFGELFLVDGDAEIEEDYWGSFVHGLVSLLG